MTAHEGVLLVAHGTVSNLDDLGEFVLRIRRGRPAPPGLVDELRHRYEKIGGSPLLELTRAQARALEEKLGAPVFVAMRLWKPGVEDVLKGEARGLSRLCVLPLAPFSVQVYFEAARRALELVKSELDPIPELVPVPAWGTHPDFVEAYAARIRVALGRMPDAEVLLTAHSLPMAVIRGGDQYGAEVQACADAIAERLGRPCRLAYQSQGADGGEWLGPDVRSTFEDLARSERRQVVLAPIGFLAEHVETLYDLDVEAQGWAKELGLTLERIAALDADPLLVSALADVAGKALGRGRL